MDSQLIFFIGLSVLSLLSLGLLYFLFYNRKVLGKRLKGFVWYWNIALSFSLVIGFFLTLESYYRFVYNQTDSFGISLVSKKWLETYYQLNDFKARDNINYQLAIPAGKRRVTFVGDSFTAGHGIKDVEDRFGNLIRAKHPELDIHILAANGMETPDQLGLLDKIRTDQYQFDLVVLVYVPNDIALFVKQTEDLYDRVKAIEAEMGFWAKNSFVFNQWYFRRKAQTEPSIRDYYSYLHKSYYGDAWRLQQAELYQVQQLVEQSGGKLAIVSFPFLHNLGQAYKFEMVHEKMALFCKQRDILYLDLYPVFEQHAYEDLVVNRYDAHPNERAHQLAAEAISAFLYSKK